MKSSSKQLKEIAADIVEGRIFCSRHIDDGDLHLLGRIFLPIGMGAMRSLSKEKLSRIGMVYAPMSDATGRWINGYPIFHSCRLMNIDVIDELDNLIRDYQEHIKGHLN